MLNSLWLMLLRWVEPGIKVWHSFVLLTRKLNRVWIQSCNSPPKGLEFRLGDGFAALKVEDDVGVACLAGLPAGRPSRFRYSDHLKQVPSEFFPESACEGFFVKKQPLYYIFTPSHLLIYIFTPSHLQI